MLGNDDVYDHVYNGQSALREMAKEPRFMRRELSKAIFNSIERMPDFGKGMGRNVSSYSSFYPDLRYVFLQVTPISKMDYETEYRPFRREMLKIACGAEKIQRPNSKKIIGIGIDAPKYAKGNSEDFVLLDCSNWSKEDEDYYNQQNQELKFFKTDSLQTNLKRIYAFPPDKKVTSNKRRVKIGRNDSCPCGSNKKYKKCCLNK